MKKTQYKELNDLLKIDNSINNCLSELKLVGVGIYNKETNFKFKKTWNLVEKPANKGKTTLIKSIYYSLFNESYKYFESYLPHDNFYVNLKYKFSSVLLNISRKKDVNNLKQEVNFKFSNEIDKKIAHLYFQYLEKIKELILINEKTIEDIELQLFEEEFEKYKEKNKELKTEKLYSIFESETGFHLNENLEEEIENLRKEKEKILSELEEDLLEIEEKLKLEEELNEKNRELTKELKNLKTKILENNPEQIYSELKELLDLYYNYKNINAKDINSSLEFDMEQVKIKINNLKKNLEENIDNLNKKLETLHLIFKSLKEETVLLLKNSNFYFDKNVYDNYSPLLKFIYTTIIKLEDYNEIEDIKNDIKLLLELKEKDYEQFKTMLDSFEELEAIYEEDDMDKLDKFLDKLLNNNSHLFINLIKKYSGNVLVFLPLIETIDKTENISKILDYRLFQFFVNLFEIDTSEDIYEVIIKISDVNNNIDYEILCDVYKQLLEILEKKTTTIFENKSKNFDKIFDSLKVFIDDLIRKTKTELDELLMIKTKTNNSDNIKNIKDISDIKEKLKEKINFSYNNKEILKNNKLNLNIDLFDELELTFYKYISEIIKEKENIEELLKNYIIKEEEKNKVEKLLEETNNIIDNLYKKYKTIHPEIEMEKYTKKDVPVKIKKIISLEKEKYDLKSNKLYGIMELQKYFKEVLNNINNYYEEKYILFKTKEIAFEFINNIVSEFLGNIKYYEKDSEIWVEYNEEDNKLSMPLKISNLYYKLLFKILNVLLLNEMFRNENQNIMLFIDNLDKELTEFEKEELFKFLEFISNKNNIQIIFTTR